MIIVFEEEPFHSDSQVVETWREAINFDICFLSWDYFSYHNVNIIILYKKEVEEGGIMREESEFQY